jgi:uncharacterized protein involved in outer membrane biogenesis
MTTRLEAGGVRLQNAAWDEAPDMLTLGRVQLAVDLRSLVGDTPVFRVLRVDDCALRFTENDAGTSNWEFSGRPDPSPDEPPAEQQGGPPVLVLDAALSDCTVRIDSPRHERPTEIGISTLTLQAKDEGGWTCGAGGSVNGEALSFSGSLQPTGALLGRRPLTYELHASAGAIELHSSGAFEDALAGQGADLEARLQGPDIRRLLGYLGLPALSDGAFDFHLRLATEESLTRLNLDGDLGTLQAEASGELDRLLQPTRGRLQAHLTGPDLAAAGLVFDIQGLPAGAYDLGADAEFAPGRANCSPPTPAPPSAARSAPAQGWPAATWISSCASPMRASSARWPANPCRQPRR